MVTQNRTLVKWFINVTVGQFTRKVEREGMCPILPEQITEMRML